MIPLSVGRIAEVVDGSLSGIDPDVVVVDVVKDSREVTQGSMFVAISGERVDGHDFAAAAVEAGSVVVLSGRPLADSAGAAIPCIIVDDPVLALGVLAAWVRRDLLDCMVIAITGSSGKTTTKDLVASILATVGPTVSPEGSFNTEVGVPLTILRADTTTRYLVLEMGMRGRGHIAYLCTLARPDLGAVVNVGSAHLGMLGTREAIAEAKAELIDALGASNAAVLNADDPLVLSMAQRTLAAVVTFGEAAEASVRATGIHLDDRARASFRLVDQRTFDVREAPVWLQAAGRHGVSNALAAAAIALSAGASLEQVAAALAAARPQSRWRMEVIETSGGFTVINDAYNANPDSMRAALTTLAAMNGRAWAVLGEMRELGQESVAQHEEIGRLVVSLDIPRLVCVGAGTLPMQRAALDAGAGGERSVYVPDVEAALELLERELRAGDIVLVKASRSIGLEGLAIRLADAVTP